MNVEQLEPRCLLSGSAVRREIMPAATLTPATTSPLVVNTLADETNPNDGLLSLREAVAQAQTSAQPITFDPSLAGGTITLLAGNGPIPITTATTISNSTTGAINIAAGAGAFLEVSSGGSLQLSNVSLIGANPALQLDSGGAATLSNVSDSAPIVDNGALIGSESQPVTWSGPISGSGSLTTSGSQPLTLTGTNSYTGGTNVGNGLSLFGNTSSLQGNIALVAPKSGTARATVLFDQSQIPNHTGTFNGRISGAGNVEFLQSANVLLGTTPDRLAPGILSCYTATIDAGATVTTSGPAQFYGTALVNNGILDLGGFNQSIPNLYGAGTIYNITTQSYPVAVLDVQYGGLFTGTLENTLPGSGNPGVLLLRLGDGSQDPSIILSLAPSGSNADTYTGGTYIEQGTLAGNTQGMQGAITGTGTAGAVVIDQSTANLATGAFFGTVSGAISLTIANGTIELPPGSSLSNTGPTTVVAGATLETGAPDQLSATSDLSLNGTLDLDGNDQSIASLAGTGVISSSMRSASGTCTLTIDGSSSSTATFRGVIEDYYPHSQNPNGVIAVQKTNAGTQQLVGANAYSGGTTVTGGELAAFSSPGDALGTGPVTVNGATLSLAGQTTTPVQEVIPVSGFNQDVIAEASATDPVAATTAAFDTSAAFQGNFVWYEQGFDGPAAAGTGLPPSGSTFKSAVNSAVSFQLQPYAQDNALLLTSVGSSASLGLVQPGQFSTLNVLASGAFGGANVNVTLDFADGSVTTFPIFVPDWFSGTPAAVNAGGRVLRQTGATVVTYGGGPYMYEFDFTLQLSDESKVLNAVTFTVAPGTFTNGNIVGIFALSGQSVQIQPQQSYANPLFVAGNSTFDVRNSLSAAMGPLTLTNGSLAITGDPGSAVQFSAVTVNGGNLSLAPAAGTSVTLRNISAPGSSLVVSGSGAVLLAGSNSYASTAVTSGTLAVFGASGLPSNTPLNVGSAGHVSLVSSGNPFTVTVSSLQLAGTMDVTTNGVQIAYTFSDPAAVIQSMIASGHLYSSRSDPDHAVGYLDTASALTPAIGSNSIQVKYTLLGDTNLDGSVTLADLLNLTRHFGQNAGWSGGDFNYNGKVDLSDFLALARHFGQSMAVAPILSAVTSIATLTPDPLDDPATGRKRRV